MHRDNHVRSIQHEAVTAVFEALRAETAALNRHRGLPSRTAGDALFARIAAEGRKPVRDASRSWLAGLSPSAVVLSGTAATLVIALRPGSLAKSYLAVPGSGYDTASAPIAAPEASGADALVAFTPEATADRIEALLRETGSHIVDGPRLGGLYSLWFGDGATSPTAAAAPIERRKRETALVRIAAPEAPADR